MPLSDEATMVLRILIGRQYVPVREVLVELGGCMGRFASAVDEIDEFIELTGDDISNARHEASSQKTRALSECLSNFILIS